MRTIVVFLADTHAGHRLGLMKPGTTVYEEDECGNLLARRPDLTATQRFLWKCYQDDIVAVRELAGDDRIVVFHVGDLTQGMKYKEQLVSTRVADQIIIAKGNLEEWLAIPNVDTLRLIVGTGSHILGEASSPILLTEMLRGKYSDHDIAPCYHGRPKIDGVIFDCAHHGPSSGIREWTQGNQLRYYLKSLVIHDILRGKHPPHLVVRAHFHKLWPETVRVRLSAWLLAALNAFEDDLDGANRLPETLSEEQRRILVKAVDIVLLPSYCGMGEFGRMATGSSSTLSNGLIAAEVIDGDLDRVHYFEREVDLRREESL